MEHIKEQTQPKIAKNTTKLTLSIAPDVIDEAKRIAKAQQTSVSAMFSEFIRSISFSQQINSVAERESNLAPSTIAPLTQSLTGILKDISDRDPKQLLEEALMEKYGLDEIISTHENFNPRTDQKDD